MRTPGNDFELAAGFVYGEASCAARNRDRGAYLLHRSEIDPDQRYNIVNVELSRSTQWPDLARFERHFTMSSSCGVCGRAQLDSLRELGAVPIDDDVLLPARVLYALPDRMRGHSESSPRPEASTLLHFSTNAEMRSSRVKTSAVTTPLDKIVGWALLNGRLPLRRCALMVSGRASYEILQKAVMAGAAIVASVSAPSSLAVELAREFNVTLAGFVRGDRANVYAAPERIV